MLKRAFPRFASRTLRAQVGFDIFSRPPCRAARPLKCAALRGPSRGTRSFALQVSPTTWVGAPQYSVPDDLKDLHAQLKRLEVDGSTFVDGSQLKLALRSVESRDAVVRVAVHALTDYDDALTFAWALLADTLEEKAEWEDALEQAKNDDDHRSILLRYNEVFSVESNNSLYRTFSIPSPFLKQHRLELLVFELQSTSQSHNTSSSHEGPNGSPAVPSLDFLNSSSGRMSSILFPAHRTILFGSGIHGVGAIGGAFRSVSETERPDMVKGIASMESFLGDTYNMDPDIALVNLLEAHEAILGYRATPKLALELKKGLIRSGLRHPATLLGVESSQSPLKPAFSALIRALLAGTDAAVVADEAWSQRDLAARTISHGARESLARAIGAWAEAAHAELRAELENAFAGEAWRKLAWWKLVWRVDDVGMIAADTLQRAYLPAAERGAIWLYGRIQEAGLLEPAAFAELPHPTNGISSPEDGRPSEPPISTVTHEATAEAAPARAAQPHWPPFVADSCRALLGTSVPPLQASAQSLLLNTLLNTASTSALAALLYVGTSWAGAYGAGSVAAAGLVWSAWHLQRHWEGAKRRWIEEVVEHGRAALKALEGRYREIVEQGGRPREDPAAREAREKTRKAVEDVREALQRLS